MKNLCFVFIFLSSFCLMAESCVYKSEIESGMNKICLYSCISGDFAITIDVIELCPMIIEK